VIVISGRSFRRAPVEDSAELPATFFWLAIVADSHWLKGFWWWFIIGANCNSKPRCNSVLWARNLQSAGSLERESVCVALGYEQSSLCPDVDTARELSPAAPMTRRQIAVQKLAPSRDSSFSVVCLVLRWGLRRNSSSPESEHRLLSAIPGP